MKDIIASSAPIGIWCIAIIELALGVLIILKGRKKLNILCAAVCFGLAIDAFIQAFGIIIKAGPFLQGLSQVRYILHGILVPLLVPISFYTYGISKKNTKIIVWAVTGVIIVLGLIMGIMTKTKPVEFAGVLRYASSEETPKFADKMSRVLSIGGVLPLIIVGIVHLVKHKSPFLMISGLLMFIFSALGPALDKNLIFYLSMFGELLMVLFFYIEIIHQNKKQNQ